MAPGWQQFQPPDSFHAMPFCLPFADVDECKEKLFCQCKDCACENTWGSYECSCGGSNLLYIREHDTCISELSNLTPLSSSGLHTIYRSSSDVTLNAAGKQSSSSLGWGFLWVIFFGLALAGAGAYAVYKYRLRVKQFTHLHLEFTPPAFFCLFGRDYAF